MSRNKTPDISCALSLVFDESIHIEDIRKELNELNLNDIIIYKPRYESNTYIDISSIKNEPDWYLDDVIKKMFSITPLGMRSIKSIVKKFNGSIIIDIAIYQYGTYPAIELLGENMKKIRYLKADVSISIY